MRTWVGRAAWALLFAGSAECWRALHGGPAPATGEAPSWRSAAQKEAAAGLLNGRAAPSGFRAAVHLVRPGENLWVLARRSGTDVDTLVGFNPDLESLRTRPGQALLLPNSRGTMHQVREGDSLRSLARLYGLPGEELRRANGMGFFFPRPGSLLFVPGGKPRQLTLPLRQAFRRRALFRSPLAGRLSSTMGRRRDPFTGAQRHHDGIDIVAFYNDWVGAAAAGRVCFVGWNGGYGKCVKLEHGNGYQSLYGHLNTIQVRLGQRLRRHQFLGRVGSTGRATAPHLHFSILRRGRAVDPLDYLW